MTKVMLAEVVQNSRNGSELEIWLRTWKGCQ
jgi:hypothetical protein